MKKFVVMLHGTTKLTVTAEEMDVIEQYHEDGRLEGMLLKFRTEGKLVGMWNGGPGTSFFERGVVRMATNKRVKKEQEPDRTAQMTLDGAGEGTNG